MGVRFPPQNKITIDNNVSSALRIFDILTSVDYLNIDTNTGSEKIDFGNITTNPTFNFLGSGPADFNGDVQLKSGNSLTLSNSSNNSDFELKNIGTTGTSVIQLGDMYLIDETTGSTRIGSLGPPLDLFDVNGRFTVSPLGVTKWLNASENSSFDITNTGATGVSELQLGDLFKIDETTGQTSIGTLTLDSSALLSLSSTTKGLLLPTPTTAQKLAIPTPADGLLVFDDVYKTPQWFDGTKWLGPDTIKLKNRTGGTISIGECVILDTVNDFSVLYPATVGDLSLIGTVVEGGANLEDVVIARGGVYSCLVKSDDDISPGDYLETDGDTPGLWKKDLGNINTSGAQCLETSASGSDRLVACILSSTLIS